MKLFRTKQPPVSLTTPPAFLHEHYKRIYAELPARINRLLVAYGKLNTRNYDKDIEYFIAYINWIKNVLAPHVNKYPMDPGDDIRIRVPQAFEKEWRASGSRPSTVPSQNKLLGFPNENVKLYAARGALLEVLVSFADKKASAMEQNLARLGLSAVRRFRASVRRHGGFAPRVR